MLRLGWTLEVGFRLKFGDARTNRSRDIRAPHFVMDDELRRQTKVNTIGRTAFDVLAKNRAAFSSLRSTSGVCRVLLHAVSDISCFSDVLCLTVRFNL